MTFQKNCELLQAIFGCLVAPEYVTRQEGTNVSRDVKLAINGVCLAGCYGPDNQRLDVRVRPQLDITVEEFRTLVYGVFLPCVVGMDVELARIPAAVSRHLQVIDDATSQEATEEAALPD